MPVKENVLNEKSINDVNYEELQKLFPHAVSIDDDGKYLIDPQKLQMSLDPSKADIKEDGYGLNWVGKKEAYHQAFSKNYKVLKPLNDENSKNWDETTNILIKGDNLDALKILRQNYFESIKMIYIDPLYNTENDEFIYNDNYTANTEEILEALGYEKEYIDYIKNIQGSKTHSGWLSFMYSRLLLAKDLLKDDGVIFISIDDNEVAQLRMLCDEIFGEQNFVAQVTRVAKRTSDKGTHFRPTKDYVLVYAKNIEKLSEFGIKKNVNESEYKLDDGNGRKYKKSGASLYQPSLDPLRGCTNQRYYIEAPDGSLIIPPGELFPKEKKNAAKVKPSSSEDNVWRWSVATYLKQKDKLIFTNGSAKNPLVDENGKQSKWNIYPKVFFDEDVKATLHPEDIIYDCPNSQGTKELKALSVPFSFPKPTRLISFLLKLTIGENSGIILDFFAGSGTTAHAVMQLNAEDGGSRQCISVQLPEFINAKKNTVAYNFVETELEKNIQKEKPTIFDITQERIKRAGAQIAKGDTGFRTFEIIEDTKQHIYQKSLEEMTQRDLISFTENLVLGSHEDILYNLLVAEGLPLSLSIETIVSDKLYLASNVAFVLGDISIDVLVENLKDKKELEFITVYSPNISDDKFTLELESAVSNIGIKPSKLRFRG